LEEEVEVVEVVEIVETVESSVVEISSFVVDPIFSELVVVVVEVGSELSPVTELGSGVLVGFVSVVVEAEAVTSS